MDNRQDGGRVEKSDSAFRTISEVATELDIPQHVLRFWEGKFPQVKPLKRAGGRRYYRPEDVALLRRIRDLLYGEGYTIKGVQKLLREGSVRAIVAPPTLELSVDGEVPDIDPSDIIEEDNNDLDDIAGNLEERIVLSADSVVLDTQNNSGFTEEFESEDASFIPESESDFSPPPIALESVLSTTPEALLDLLPAEDGAEITTLSAEAVDDEKEGEDTTLLIAEPETPEIHLSQQELKIDTAPTLPEQTLELNQEPLESLSTETVVENVDTLVSEMDIPDTITIKRDSLRTILSELESLRFLLRNS